MTENQFDKSPIVNVFLKSKVFYIEIKIIYYNLIILCSKDVFPNLIEINFDSRAAVVFIFNTLKINKVL